MRFLETAIPGAYVVEIEPVADARGFFARTWCRDEAAARGLRADVVQCNVSRNARRGTLRGMHLQRAPHGEAKLVRCTRGAVHDVVVDLRPESPACRRWIAAELREDNHRALYIPEGCAHGFQTLTDDAEVFYQMFARYEPGAAAGVRWDDPALAIAWPGPVTEISERDRAYPLLAP